METNRELFDEQRHPRFGTANPERMRLAHWEWMVRCGQDPFFVRHQLGLEHADDAGPDWCFCRMGATRTELPDGRVIHVAGEHEDWYDPDFCIYNDIIVRGPDDRVEIYGYPKDVFPPTDFHTATLVGDRLILIGSLADVNERMPGFTPVYTLDLTTYRIAEARTTGAMPGWIFQHEAAFDAERQVITVRGGRVNTALGGEHWWRRNAEDFELDIRAWVWCQVTQRNWPQFFIRREDGDFLEEFSEPPPIPTAETEPEPPGFSAPDEFLQPATLFPRQVPHAILPCDQWGVGRIAVQGVPLSVIIEQHEIHVMVEGQLPEALVAQLVEEIRANAEASIGHPCLAEPA